MNLDFGLVIWPILLFFVAAFFIREATEMLLPTFERTLALRSGRGDLTRLLIVYALFALPVANLGVTPVVGGALGSASTVEAPLIQGLAVLCVALYLRLALLVFEDATRTLVATWIPLSWATLLMLVVLDPKAAGEWFQLQLADSRFQVVSATFLLGLVTVAIVGELIIFVARHFSTKNHAASSV